MLGDFDALAKVALGTDDPERIAALKEAIKACVADDESGEYDSDVAEGGGEVLSTLFGGKKAK